MAPICLDSLMYSEDLLSWLMSVVPSSHANAILLIELKTDCVIP